MKKLQYASEFLTTYGWALLVGLSLTAALAYFGVFDFCMWGENCNEHKTLNCGECDGCELMFVENESNIISCCKEVFYDEDNGCSWVRQETKIHLDGTITSEERIWSAGK